MAALAIDGGIRDVRVQFIERMMVVTGNSADDELKDGVKTAVKGQSCEGVEE